MKLLTQFLSDKTLQNGWVYCFRHHRYRNHEEGFQIHGGLGGFDLSWNKKLLHVQEGALKM